MRLSSVEVIHVKDSLLEALATEPKVCPHLHVPMQSGDDDVLEAMGRHYTAGEYLASIAALRESRAARERHDRRDRRLPDRDRRRVRADPRRRRRRRDHPGPHVLVLPAPGTQAERLGDRVPPEEKKRRSRELRGRSEVRSRHHRTAKLGGRERVLIDKVADTQCSGYTADYTRCYLPGGAAGRGEIIDVACVELQADGIRCR